MVDSVSNSTSAASSASDSALKKLSQDYTTFLKMLTTQLQNQDPLSPMDSAQFTQQLVSFAAVEQQISANENLEELLALQKTSGTGAMLNYIGKELELNSADLSLVNGGPAKFAYTLGQNLGELKITITDQNGATIRTFTSENRTAGKHEVSWDGKNDSGITVKDGVYRIKVEGKSTNGQNVAIGISTFGVVDGVQASETGALLSIGKLVTGVDTILAIRDKPPAPTPPAEEA